MSPLIIAEWMSVSGTLFPSPTLRSNSLAASSGVTVGTIGSAISLSVESSADDVHLLVTGQPDEIHRIPGDPDRECRIVFWVVHGVQQGFAVQDVDVHVVARRPEEGVEHRSQIGHAIFAGAPK